MGGDRTFRRLFLLKDSGSSYSGFTAYGNDGVIDQ